MKYYLIKLPYFKSGHQYPPDYENTIGIHNQGHVYFDDPEDGTFKLLIALFDVNKVAELPENVTELTESEATTLGDKYDPSVETITNEAVVRRLAIKVDLGEALTVQEMKALDPNDPEPGFGKTESFSTRVSKVVEK